MGRPTEWTEERALALAEGMIAWLEEDSARVFWQEYILQQGLYKQIISDLSKKYASFSALIKRAREIQELRLQNIALNTGKPIGAIFLLKNHHGYADKQEIKTDNVNRNLDTKALAAATESELKDMLRNLSEESEAVQ